MADDGSNVAHHFAGFNSRRYLPEQQADACQCNLRLLGEAIHYDSKRDAFRALAGGYHRNLLKHVVLHHPILAKHAYAHNERSVRLTETMVLTEFSVDRTESE
jgi:hypothetical protein